MSKKFLFIFLITFIISLLLFFVVFICTQFYRNHNLTTFSIIGPDYITINPYEDFIAYEVIATFRNEDISNFVSITNSVDNTKLGTYPLTYNLAHAKAANLSITKYIIVEDNISPEILLTGNSEISITQYSNYSEPRFYCNR